MVFLVLFIIICGILLINQRNEEFGLFKAIKSLFMLLIILGCLALTTTGIGAVVGVPVLWAIARSASRKM